MGHDSFAEDVAEDVHILEELAEDVHILVEDEEHTAIAIDKVLGGTVQCQLQLQ